MEITTQERVKDLKFYKFNEELFELLKGSDYKALKDDIKKNGVKVELHILPDKTVICGHQRLQIAKEKDIDIKHLRCKTVYGLDTPEMVREYVILDNLLRRQLTPEKQAFLLDDLSKQYETGRGAKEFQGNQYKSGEKDNMSSTPNEQDVNSKTAKKVNVSSKTVQRARAYVKAVNENPKEYKGKKITKVLNLESKKRKKEQRVKLGKKINVKDLNIDFRLGDFTKVLDGIPDNSIDLIITDPPYDKESIFLYGELSKLAKRVLKKNCFCIVYSGVMYLSEIMEQMNNNLDYYWIYALVYPDTHTKVMGRNILQGWKPFLVYQNGFKKNKELFTDVIDGSGMAKQNHPWEQSMDELTKIIEYFTQPGDTILDPMSGSGSTLIISKKLKRKPLGVEINEDTYDAAKKRIKEAFDEI